LSKNSGSESRSKNDRGSTELLDRCLLFSACCGQDEALKLLLEAGANTESRSSSGATALHLACMSSQSVSCVQALLACGADLFALDDEGHSPIDLALEDDTGDAGALSVLREAWVAVRPELLSQAAELADLPAQEAAEEILRSVRQGGRSSSSSSNATTKQQSNDLRMLREQAQRDSEHFHDALWGGLKHLRKRVRALDQNLRSSHSQPHAARELQVVATGVERELESYKAQHRPDFEALLNEEAELEESLSSYSRRFEKWSKESSCISRPARAVAAAAASVENASGGGSSSSSSKKDAATSKLMQQQDDPEVSALKAELSAIDDEERRLGGPNGGWPASSNENFLRIMRMFKNQANEKCYEKLVKCFPDFSRAKIEDHVTWAAGQEKRQAERKRLFSRWRLRRTELEHEMNQADERCLAEAQEQQRQAKRRERQLREEQRRRVQEWREEQLEKEKAAMSWQRKVNEERALRQVQALEEERSLRAEQREACQAYRRAKEKQQRPTTPSAQRLVRNGTPNRRAFSQEDRQRIAHRNLDMLRRKLQQSQVDTGYPPEIIRNASYDAVESRLYNATESFVQKKATKIAEGAPHVVVPGVAPAPPIPPRLPAAVQK
jgi:hypothetical protein